MGLHPSRDHHLSPRVFWLHFESIPNNLDRYRAVIFGFSSFAFPVESVFAFLMFHGLVWSAFLVVGGVMLTMRRRMRDEGAAALQLFGEDFMPLILLFAVSLTGLMLTASYQLRVIEMLSDQQGGGGSFTGGGSHLFG